MRGSKIYYTSALSQCYSCLFLRRFGISWGVMGALEDCIERTRSYALERHQFGRPLASFQLVQKKLVDAQSEVALGLLASLQVCIHDDSDDDGGSH